MLKNKLKKKPKSNYFYNIEYYKQNYLAFSDPEVCGTQTGNLQRVNSKSDQLNYTP